MKMRITEEQIKGASEDVAWEYVAMLGAALEIAKGPSLPSNHFLQEAFLVHVRNLAEFFWRGVRDFDPSAPVERDDEDHDDIYAVDLCSKVLWHNQPFGNRKFGDTNLIKAINKTLSHMTYSRRLPMLPSRISVVFDSHNHIHGTVKLIRLTWTKFMASVRAEFLSPQFPEDIHFWLSKHTTDWPVNFDDLEGEFEAWNVKRARELPDYWHLNQTPDGPV